MQLTAYGIFLQVYWCVLMNLLGDRKYFCITDRIQLLESFSFEHVYFDDGVYFVMTMSEHKSK